ncbi:phosphoesterase family-domain-containing protein [Penicillium chermesinum]|uniref:Phosphoesterase family-domain-containing protein n=1 Tax=Penicillium chermesinum TaxID=63820 RepID=A0A9W9NUA9_9EURO|nr:phosphoesterase family-domain-containing protein [Penicillium chermesinum]KAJ5226305.1 phosphoesterase family-domain-containing protein [Penicillium chermesinum]
MSYFLGAALALMLGSSPASASSLSDIEHVVIFMQENRAWDHYFGSMAGVRGFNDPNVQINSDGLSVYHQIVDPDMSTDAQTLLPWYLGYEGGDSVNAIQCMAAGSNGYTENQAALNGDLNNHWARNNTPWSWGYLKRSDIPIHFAIAEAWTSGDMYQESQITATNPNRVTLVSGSINVPGGPQNPSQGGPYIDNNEVPGCESDGQSCYPLKWKTVYEFYEDAGVTWQVYQDTNNFDDNPLAWFQQFQKAGKGSPLADKGMAFNGLESFYAAAANGTLPEVSFIVGPAELSEHPSYQPKDGAWLQKKVVDAVTQSPKYSSTLLMISYDETGGFGDHVTPFHSPRDTPGEWMEDPLGIFGDIYSGPGFRVPFYIVSPWTRGGRVFTERADHNSQILFVEQWLQARGYKNIQTDQMVPWRRAHMSNLINALDLDHPNLDIPIIPEAETPVTNDNGDYVGSAQCQAKYPTQRPTVPYGQQDNSTNTLFFEDGFKEVVGYLTEGRYLTFEKNSKALAASRSDSVSATDATPKHDTKSQRWVIHYTEDEESEIFTISSAFDNRWIGAKGALRDDASDAAQIRTSFLGNGSGYTLQFVDGGAYLDISSGGFELVSSDQVPNPGFKVFSVSYHD